MPTFPRSPRQAPQRRYGLAFLWLCAAGLALLVEGFLTAQAGLVHSAGEQLAPVQGALSEAGEAADGVARLVRLALTLLRSIY